MVEKVFCGRERCRCKRSICVEYRHKNDGGDSLPAASRADTSADSKPGAAPIPDARTQPSLSKYCFQSARWSSCRSIQHTKNILNHGSAYRWKVAIRFFVRCAGDLYPNARELFLKGFF